MSTPPRRRSAGRARTRQLAGLADKPIRWICEDAMKFVEREERRGSRYDIILFDPPAYGRGPKGEVWQLFEHLPAMTDICRSILTPKPLAVVLTAYSIRASFFAIHALMRDTFAGMGGTVELGELVIREKAAGRALSTSLFSRWVAPMSEHRDQARPAGQGSHQPRQSAGQGHQGAGAEEIPRPAECLHRRRAEAGHRRARSRLDDQDADLRQGRPRQSGGRKGRGAHRGRWRRRARSLREGDLGRSPAATIRKPWSACSSQRFVPLKDIRPRDGDVWVALDRVRDPGNLGTVIRTVDAVGAKGVILVGETTDPFSLETVRATMGSIFAVPVAKANAGSLPRLAQGLSRHRRRHPSQGRGRLPLRRFRQPPVAAPDGQRAAGPARRSGRKPATACCAFRRRAAPIRSILPSPPASCCSRSGATR